VKIPIAFFLTALFSFAVFHYSGVNTLPIQSEDTVPTMFLPVTILKEGTLYADNYYQMMVNRYPQPDDKEQRLGYTPFYLKKIIAGDQTHYITAFTIVPGLLAVPVYALPIIFGMDITWENLILLSHISASLVVALAGAVLYLMLKKHLLPTIEDSKKITLILIIYLFGTVNFAMISQSLWQHGAVQLFTLLGILTLLNGIKSRSLFQFTLAGLCLSLAVLSRPTAALFAILLSLLILLAHKDSLKQSLKASIYLGLGVVPALLFFLWYNQVYFIGLENQGYAGQLFSSWFSPFPEGFLGTWLSPSKGILVYSPVLTFSLVGLYKAYKHKELEHRSLYLFSGLIILCHTLLMGKWKHWYGGFSFGYRLTSDALPFFMLLLVPFLQGNIYPRLKKLVYALLAFSIFVQISGLIFFDGIWHNAYDRGFNDTSWLWSVRDSEAAFNIRRVLVKFGYLETACPKCHPNTTD
jgi:hypothetical protein